METIRSFVAIELSNQAKDSLVDLQERLKQAVPPRTVRWTAPANIHLTLHFLGNIPTADIDPVSQAITAASLTTAPFSLTLKGLGCFPNMRRPRVVWVGVEGDVPILTALRQELGQNLNRAIRFEPDSRPYRPHLTIGRVRKGLASRDLNRLGRALSQIQPDIKTLAGLEAQAISLMQSDLKPGGAVYTRLAHIPLPE